MWQHVKLPEQIHPWDTLAVAELSIGRVLPALKLNAAELRSSQICCGHQKKNRSSFSFLPPDPKLSSLNKGRSVAQSESLTLPCMKSETWLWHGVIL